MTIRIELLFFLVSNSIQCSNALTHPRRRFGVGPVPCVVDALQVFPKVRLSVSSAKGVPLKRTKFLDFVLNRLRLRQFLRRLGTPALSLGTSRAIA